MRQILYERPKTGSFFFLDSATLLTWLLLLLCLASSQSQALSANQTEALRLAYAPTLNHL